jgi:hypothetical protein
MATNVVSAVHQLATAALKSGHPLHGAVMPPSKWATEAGFPGSKASPLREHMARKSANGVGRSGRYAPQDARGMLDLLSEADRFLEAETKAKQDVARKRVRRALDKNRAAAARGGKQAKTQATRKRRTKASA